MERRGPASLRQFERSAPYGSRIVFARTFDMLVGAGAHAIAAMEGSFQPSVTDLPDFVSQPADLEVHVNVSKWAGTMSFTEKPRQQQQS